MAAKPKTTRTRRSKGQAQWLRERIEAEHPGFNPVLEMVKMYHKPRLRKGDLERLQILVEIAKYVQPKVKMVEHDLAAAPEGDGVLTIKWKG